MFYEGSASFLQCLPLLPPGTDPFYIPPDGADIGWGEYPTCVSPDEWTNITRCIETYLIIYT